MNKLERIKKLEDELALLKKQVTDEEQWEPCGGEWFVSRNGKVSNAESTYGSRKFGIEFPTEKQAETAAEAMRIHNRLLAYVDEFDPDWQADWDDNRHVYQRKFYVYKNMDAKQWHKGFDCGCYSPDRVYMSETCAEDLTRKLNSGQVIL